MAWGTAHNRNTILHIITALFFLISFTASSSAATGSDTYPGLNISIRTNQTVYTCSDGCSILITLENSGPINGSVTNLTLLNRFSKTTPDRLGISTRFGTEDNFTYHGSYSNLDRIGLPERQGQAFWNRSRDSVQEPYTVQLRLNLTSATAQYWDIILRPGVDGANQDWYRNLSVRTEIRTLQLIAPEDGYNPDDRQITFRFLPDVPDVSRIPCAVRYKGATVARNVTVTGTTAILNARLHPGETAGKWHVWCDTDNDTSQDPGETSASRSLDDSEAPAVTFGGIFQGRTVTPPGEIAVRITDNFLGVEEARFSIVQDGVNRTSGGLSGSSFLTRFGNSSIFNASFDVTAFTEGQHTVWITARDAAGNLQTRKTSLTVDLITRRPGFYWNRVHGLNLSTSSVHTCAPSCTAVVRLRNHGSLSGRIEALNVSHSFSSGSTPNIQVQVRRDGNQYQSLQNMVGSRFYNHSVQRPGNPATYSFKFRINDHQGSGYWNTTIFLGIMEDGTTRYRRFTVRSAIQDIELLAPANRTVPGNRLVNFSFRFRSPLREELPCAILFQGDTPADIELQNSTVGMLTEVQLQPRRYPARWRVWCDNDRDGRQERGEYSGYRWFNDTVSPTIDLQRPRSGKTLSRDPLTIKATAQDNFLGLERVSYSILRIRNGSRRTFRTGRLKRQENDGFRTRLSVADLPDQNYTVQVEAVDRAGNTGTAATHATLAVDEGSSGIGASLMSWVQELISSSKKKEQQKEEKMKPFSSEIINLLIFIVLMVVGGIATYWLVSSNVDY